MKETGEGFALLRPAALESVLARPRNRYFYDSEDDVLQLAVTLMFGIANNHPFEQGNKRTGFVGGMMFMRLNGYGFAVDSADFSDDFVRVITGEMNEWTYACRMSAHVVAISDDDI